MGDPLRVLVYGSVDAGPCDSVRLGVYRDLLLDHGVEMRTWGELNDFRVQVPPGYADRLDDAIRDGVATVDTSPIEWADVVLFRRWYGTVHACDVCDFAAAGPDGLAAHALATGHAPIARDRIIRSLLSSIERDPAVLRGRAMVYELDDNLLAAQPWLGFYNRLVGDRDLIERFARRADLVTVSTPTLAGAFGRYNSAVRVVRNAIMPEWYSAPVEPATSPQLSFLYYGVGARARDYAICQAAVDSVAAEHAGRRIWIGSDEPAISRIVDETHPYTPEVRGFARQLVAARPSVGVAPVGQDDFSRGRSELHWLEYSMAGAATVASRTMGGGPYDVIRDGVDGLLARNKAQWREQLTRLAVSAALREELAGRAKERVLAEYDARQRVAEWADAFRWAADHAGRGAIRAGWAGATTRQKGDAAKSAARSAAQSAADAAQSAARSIEAEASAGLAHRRLVRRREAEEPATLAALRGEHDVCWPEEAAVDPLVSVVIPTYNRGRVLVERSLASVLSQTYTNLDVVVVGDHATAETLAAIRSVEDPRVRFVDLPERSPYPDDPEQAWMCVGSRPFNRGLALARGSWIAPQADDDEFTPDHVEVLLSVAIENRLEFVYGDSWMETPEGFWHRVGEWPPRQAGFCAGAVLYSSALRFIQEDEECWRDNEPNDWNMWKRMMAAGVRAGHVEQIVFRHYLEARHRYPAKAGAA